MCVSLVVSMSMHVCVCLFISLWVILRMRVSVFVCISLCFQCIVDIIAMSVLPYNLWPYKKKFKLLYYKFILISLKDTDILDKLNILQHVFLSQFFTNTHKKNYFWFLRYIHISIIRKKKEKIYSYSNFGGSKK